MVSNSREERRMESYTGKPRSMKAEEWFIHRVEHNEPPLIFCNGMAIRLRRVGC